MENNHNVTTVKGLQNFAHGPYYGKMGDIMEMPTAIANDLAAAGLVATVTEKVYRPAAAPADAPPAEDAPGIKAAAVLKNKMAKPSANKK